MSENRPERGALESQNARRFELSEKISGYSVPEYQIDGVSKQFSELFNLGGMIDTTDNSIDIMHDDETVTDFLAKHFIIGTDKDHLIDTLADKVKSVGYYFGNLKKSENNRRRSILLVPPNANIVIIHNIGNNITPKDEYSNVLLPEHFKATNLSEIDGHTITEFYKVVETFLKINFYPDVLLNTTAVVRPDLKNNIPMNIISTLNKQAEQSSKVIMSARLGTESHNKIGRNLQARIELVNASLENNAQIIEIHHPDKRIYF